MIGIVQLLAGILLTLSGVILVWWGGYNFLGWADTALGLVCMWNAISPPPPPPRDRFERHSSLYSGV